jgi:hypothetical protein
MLYAENLELLTPLSEHWPSEYHVRCPLPAYVVPQPACAQGILACAPPASEERAVGASLEFRDETFWMLGRLARR